MDSDVPTLSDDAISGASGDPPHFVRFYDHDATLIDEASDFIDSALRARGTGIVIATPVHLAELRRRLAGLGSADGRPAWFSGHLILLDAEQALGQFMVDGWPDAQRFRETIGATVAAACARGGAVHVFGEMAALLVAAGRHDAAARIERQWDELADTLDFSLLCAYPQAGAGTSGRPLHRAQAGSAAGAQAPSAASTTAMLEAEIARRKEAESTLRRREKEFADFIENAAEGLHRVAGDGTILWANRAELQMLGYGWDEYVGRHIAEFHVDADVINHILATLSSGGTLYDQPARLRCKDGSIKHVVIHSNGHFEDGQLRYTRCFTRDATERHQLAQAHAEREQLLEELTAANRTKDEFLAMLGHELRNPLSPIVTALQLMRMRGETGAAREREIIERQVDHLVRLVDDLMDVARATRGQIELKCERGDIAGPLAKAVEMAGPLLERRAHRLEVDVEAGLVWEGDAARLAQVVSNLLTNAARYTEPGGQVVLRARREASGWLRISVRDNGIGLAPDMLERVFGLFFQGQRGVDRREGGLGIGLALVRNIVDLHGGKVEAGSAGPGQGSEFVVRLPAAKPGALAGQETGAEAALPAAPIDRKRIMVVDDNADAAETLGLLLAAHGHLVEVFNDPASALDALARMGPATRPDIAVLDIGLPVLDGYQLAAHMRALLGNHPCRMIALTGYGQDADLARSAAAGFERHLVKPITPEQVANLADPAGLQ